MYAIVDIETTGGNASNGRMTEIAIILHDGKRVEERFCSLINPGVSIPRYITALTGIHDGLVANAPAFEEIAGEIFSLLKDRIFIAHNVNFDFSFVHHHLKESGVDWQAKKLCTVRYARKVIPGLTSYSLGNLCRSLGIEISDRHRAKGDAEATVKLFELLTEKDEQKKHLLEMTKGRNPHSYLPMNMPLEAIHELPFCAGVYYFKNKAGKVIYVGKAKNLKYRVRSHFSNNETGKKKQELIREVFSIDYRTCSTELMALVLESIEIKRLWPKWNRSQKQFETAYGLYRIEDCAGRIRLLIDKKKKYLNPIHTFSRLNEGYQLIRRLSEKIGFEHGHAIGMLKSDEEIAPDFNEKMEHLISEIKSFLPDFCIIQPAEELPGEKKWVVFLVENGRFIGMGTSVQKPYDWDNLKSMIEPYPENEFIRNTLMDYSIKHKDELFEKDVFLNR